MIEKTQCIYNIIVGYEKQYAKSLLLIDISGIY